MERDKITPLEKSIGEKIGKLRADNNGETQEALAASIGVSREIIQHWERGTRHIKADHIKALALHFGVSANYLLGLSEHPTADLKEAAAADYAGLSLEAMRALTKLKRMSLLSETLSYFISSVQFKQIVIDLFHFRERVKEAVDMAEDPAAEWFNSAQKLQNAQFMEFLATQNFDTLFRQVLKEEVSKSSVIRKSPDGEGYIWQWTFGGNDNG